MPSLASSALQLCLLRRRGHFMSPEQGRVPLRVVNYLGEQLGFQPTLFLPPLQREATWLEHRKHIRAYLEFKPFDRKERAALEAWLKQSLRDSEFSSHFKADEVIATHRDDLICAPDVAARSKGGSLDRMA